MKFEEEFPSLKGKISPLTHHVDTIRAIQKVCLDKKRIAEIIDKCLTTCVCQNCITWSRRLKKELRLE